MSEKQEIYKALTAAQSKIQAAGKSGENTYDKYKYAMLQDYCVAIHEPMTANGLAFSVSVDDVIEMADRTTTGGKTEHVVRVKLRGILSHSSGETLEFTGYGEGQDRADKGLYKAITGGKKYLIANIFNVPTVDDPETDSHEDFDQRPGNDRQKLPTQPQPRQSVGNAPKTEGKSNPVQSIPSATPSASGPVPAPQTLNDAEQIKRGLINSTLIAEFKAAARSAKISGQVMMDWLLTYSTALVQAGRFAQPFKHPKDIPTAAYKEILETVQNHPEQITGKPAGDDALGF